MFWPAVDRGETHIEDICDRSRRQRIESGERNGASVGAKAQGNRRRRTAHTSYDSLAATLLLFDVVLA